MAQFIFTTKAKARTFPRHVPTTTLTGMGDVVWLLQVMAVMAAMSVPMLAVEMLVVSKVASVAEWGMRGGGCFW
jgi:hypothetical protein